MQARLDWDRDGADWPLREYSRFVETGTQACGLRWHVQHLPSTRAGAPRCLLIHGTGASTHTWRDVAPLLREHFELLSIDLPGHAFTAMPAGGIHSPFLGLQGMALALGRLLATMEFSPDLIVGHSAGAAIGARLCLDGAAHPKLLVSLNGALLPLGGLAGKIFAPAARLMVAVPGVSRLFAWRASDAQVIQGLLDSTGSALDARGRELYRRLASNPGHVEGALGMMAGWDLPALEPELTRLEPTLVLMVGTHDATVPPTEADRLLARLGGRVPARKVVFEGLGHLAHEERPAAFVQALAAAWLVGRPA